VFVVIGDGVGLTPGGALAESMVGSAGCVLGNVAAWWLLGGYLVAGRGRVCTGCRLLVWDPEGSARFRAGFVESRRGGLGTDERGARARFTELWSGCNGEVGHG